MNTLARSAWLYAWLMLLAPLAHAADYGFEIIRAALRPNTENNGYLLDTDINYRFSEPAIDALRNGISLGLVLRLQIEQEGAWWDRTVRDERYAFRIRYHALSKLFQILDGNDEAPRNFISLNALLEAMGTVRDLPIHLTGLTKGEHYRASLSVSLDIEALPLPLRPVAYATPAWHLESPVYKWTFAE
jgi:hypothetical protein